MSKRLQVILQDKELAEIQQSARRQQMTTAEWVRQALRAARRGKSGAAASKKLAVVRAAARHAFPSPDIGRMLDEIERGYLDESPR
ncbi:MAG: antitoxin [Pseudomonadota bacterium]|nr:antitoxin [Pseudomonadota bacterium]